MMAGPSHQRGFSLLELTVSLTLLVGMLLIAISTSKVVTETSLNQVQASDVGHRAHRLAQRLGLTARPGLLSTFKVRATQADVDAAIAAGVTPPALGDWTPAPQLDARPNLQLQAADGVASIMGMVVTGPLDLELVLEGGETDNDLDDDGDGLVDEGSLNLSFGGTEITLGTGVEVCTFELDGQMLLISLQCALRDKNGRVLRAALQRSVWIRN